MDSAAEAAMNGKRGKAVWTAAVVLMAVACVPLSDWMAAAGDGFGSSPSVLPTYTLYPTYTILPESTREITKLAVITNTPDPTPTKTDWKPTPVRYTPLPTADLTDLPENIIQGSMVSGVEPYEAVYLFNLLQKVAQDRDPRPLLEFFRFPLHQTGKCPGDVIENPEEFVRHFSTIMNETTRKNILQIKLEDVFLNWRGMALAANYRYDIWITAYLGGEGTYFVMESFLGYSIFWERVEADPDPATW
jgi:hypothetical protein